MKKQVSLILAVITVISTVLLAGCGCGGNGAGGFSGKKVEATLDKEHVFKGEDIGLNGAFTDIKTFALVGNTVCLYGNNWDEDDGGNKLVSYNLDTKEMTSTKLVTGYENVLADTQDEEPMGADDSENYEYNNIWVNDATFDSNGNITCLVDIYHEKQADGIYESSGKFYLMNFDINGNKNWESVIFDQSQNPDEYFYLQSIKALDDGTIIALKDGELLIYNGDNGELKKTVDITNFAYLDLYKTKNNKVIAAAWDSDYITQNLYEFDVQTGTVGKTLDKPAELGNLSIYSDGRVNDLILQGNNEVYGYDFGGQLVEIMDVIDSDIYCYDFEQIAMVDGEHFVACYSDPDDWTMNVVYFSKVAPSDVVEKKPLVLGGLYISSQIKKRVIDFNKKSDEFRIQINDYEKYWSGDDYRAGYTKLNNDIVSGNVPDILICDNSVPFESYANKGLFTDIGKLIDEDPSINRSDYMSNIFDACLINDTLYCLVTQFAVNTLAGKTSTIGDRSSWTMDEFVNFAAGLEPGVALVNGMSQEEFLQQYSYCAANQYIDYGKATCNFDDGNFANVLEICKKYFPKEIDYSDEDYWADYDASYRNGTAALGYTYLGDFSAFPRMEQGMFGAPITFIGYPYSDGNGSILQFSDKFCISAMTPYTDGCWDFIKYYISDEYQDSLNWQFPVKISSLEKLGAKATERPYWENEDGSKEYYDDTYYIGNEEVILHPLTQAEVDKYIEYLKSLTIVGSYNEEISNIITEETAPFFAGQKSAQDCCAIIQSRISILLSESN